MAEFLVESYVSRAGAEAEVARAAARMRATASDGGAVRYLRSIFVPEDETCFYVFESPSSRAVEDLCRRAALTFDRVTEVVEPFTSQGDTG
jgi:hypothetical protein